MPGKKPNGVTIHPSVRLANGLTGAGAPPTVIFHGTADETVAFADVQRFCELMKAAGNLCALVPFEGASHGFFNYRRSRTAFDATLREGDAFLKSLGYLSGLTREPDQQGTP